MGTPHLFLRTTQPKRQPWPHDKSCPLRPSAGGAAEVSPARKRWDPFRSTPTQIPLRESCLAKSHLKFSLEIPGRQDRRRSDKYELTTENTNNPNTAKPRNTTITGLPSKHPYTLQTTAHFPSLPFQPLNDSSPVHLSLWVDTPAIQLQHSAPQS